MSAVIYCLLLPGSWVPALFMAQSHKSAPELAAGSALEAEEEERRRQEGEESLDGQGAPGL